MATTTTAGSGSGPSTASSPAALNAPAVHPEASGTALPTTSDWQELRLAARAVLQEADARSESAHPMRYTCPWKQLTRLRKALEAL